ncbi:hypothetical protein D3C78_1745490 [compost metagenome]
MDLVVEPLVNDTGIMNVRMQEAEAALAQCGVFLTQSNHQFIEIIQLAILFMRIPDHTFAAIGIAIS